MGPGGGLDFYEEMNVLLMPGFEPTIVQPVAKALRIPG